MPAQPWIINPEWVASNPRPNKLIGNLVLALLQAENLQLDYDCLKLKMTNLAMKSVNRSIVRQFLKSFSRRLTSAASIAEKRFGAEAKQLFMVLASQAAKDIQKLERSRPQKGRRATRRVAADSKKTKRTSAH